jgi:hypothetical protein
VGKPEGNSLLGRPSVDGEISEDLTDLGWDGQDFIHQDS